MPVLNQAETGTRQPAPHQQDTVEIEQGIGEERFALKRENFPGVRQGSLIAARQPFPEGRQARFHVLQPFEIGRAVGIVVRIGQGQVRYRPAQRGEINLVKVSFAGTKRILNQRRFIHQQYPARVVRGRSGGGKVIGFGAHTGTRRFYYRFFDSEVLMAAEPFERAVLRQESVTFEPGGLCWKRARQFCPYLAQHPILPQGGSKLVLAVSKGLAGVCQGFRPGAFPDDHIPRKRHRPFFRQAGLHPVALFIIQRPVVQQNLGDVAVPLLPIGKPHANPKFVRHAPDIRPCCRSEKFIVAVQGELFPLFDNGIDAGTRCGGQPGGINTDTCGEFQVAGAVALRSQRPPGRVSRPEPISDNAPVIGGRVRIQRCHGKHRPILAGPLPLQRHRQERLSLKAYRGTAVDRLFGAKRLTARIRLDRVKPMPGAVLPGGDGGTVTGQFAGVQP
ncbi:MAG: hypothetical protein BWX80_01370 [Candidatus Hydrogenedentes bacterium ADurb.Bin101]|nr:MAG: hypothetical protein BWX80_01370 [Candidatus Hydrogenedentes bacterium ADurb.Bin101]